jgi:cbb3-type cytochrome oxidase subunit 3
MGLILLEALLALLLLLLIVWWTMFSGRQKGELTQTQNDEEMQKTEQSAAVTAEKEGAKDV